MGADFRVAVAAGSLEATIEVVIRLPHPWRPGGVAVQTAEG